MGDGTLHLVASRGSVASRHLLWKLPLCSQFAEPVVRVDPEQRSLIFGDCDSSHQSRRFVQPSDLVQPGPTWFNLVHPASNLHPTCIQLASNLRPTCIRQGCKVRRRASLSNPSTAFIDPSLSTASCFLFSKTRFDDNQEWRALACLVA